MSFNFLFDGAFNVNPRSNLILTVRLTGEVAMNKRLGQGKSSFIVIIPKEIFGREEEKRESEGLKRF